MNRPTVFALAGLFLLLRCVCAYQRAKVPFELDYEEGNVLNAGIRVLQKATPYPPPGSFPYIVNTYGPVGYLVSAAAVDVGGRSLTPPRLLVLGGGICIVFAITALVGTVTRRSDVGFVLGVLYLCSPLAWKWLPLLRVDFWAVLFSLLGLYAFVRWPDRTQFAAVLFSLAILTKHTALAAPTACLMELIIEKRKKNAASLIATLGAITSVVVVALGPSFRFALFQAHPDPYSWARLFRFYASAIQATILPLVILLLAVLYGFRWKANSRLLWLYTALASVTALTAGKLGSETNHFLEWTAAVTVISAASLSHLVETQNTLAKPLLAGAMVLTGVFAFFPNHWVNAAIDQSQCSQAYEMVQNSKGQQILSEDIAALVVAGKPVAVSNPFVVTQLASRVKWSAGSMEEMVQRRQFDLILLGGPTQAFIPASGRWSSVLIENVAKNYQLAAEYKCAPALGAAYVRKNDANNAQNPVPNRTKPSAGSSRERL